jgi:D-alanyl-D-alanine carboxypeptidase/D-alanyl-D-alanine-endopeptidase (penicillin-binding protein 4)
MAPVVTETGQEAMVCEQQQPWPMGMQWKLDSILRDPLLDQTQVGMMVWDLTDNKSLFAFNQRQLLRPASTMKLLTAITALDQLGGNYQFRTSLYYKGELTGHTLQGSLYCVGGMDPMFSGDDLREFANSVKRMGIDTIVGNIVADVSMKDTLKWGEGWCWDDDNPTLSPLLVSRKAGFTSMLANELANAQVVLKGRARGTETLPAGAVLVSERRHSIDQVLLLMMKESDNLYAECLFYQLAARYGSKPARAIHGRTLEKQLVNHIGLDASNYKFADGSGLSLYNYVSPELLTVLLRYAWQQPTIYNHLLPSLPIAGVDGTLKKRMRNTSAEGNVRAKTGTLTGVISLAGYLTAANGHQLCFTIINQGVMRGSEARKFQDRMCV